MNYEIEVILDVEYPEKFVAYLAVIFVPGESLHGTEQR